MSSHSACTLRCSACGGEGMTKNEMNVRRFRPAAQPLESSPQAIPCPPETVLTTTAMMSVHGIACPPQCSLIGASPQRASSTSHTTQHRRQTRAALAGIAAGLAETRTLPGERGRDGGAPS